MKKRITGLLLLMSALPAAAGAAEDCMIVDFPDHVELVCTGDGVRMPGSGEKLARELETAAAPAAQTSGEAAAVEKDKAEAPVKAEAVRPEQRVIVPRSLQIRLDRAAQTMERMRMQKLQRDTGSSAAPRTP